MENKKFGKYNGIRIVPNRVRKVIKRLPDEFTRNDIVSLLNISKSQARLYAQYSVRYNFSEIIGNVPNSKLIKYKRII